MTVRSFPMTARFVELRLRIATLAGLAATLLAGDARAAAQPPAALDALIRKSCLDCHADEPGGGLDLRSLDFELSQAATFAKWERIYDRVAAGEMPPPDAEPPTTAARQTALADLAAALTAAHRAEKGTVLRRLNRREYENTLNDLFGTRVDLVNTLPEDGRSHEFDTVGEALGLSAVQLERYLAGIETVFDAAISKTLTAPTVKTIRASYADTRGAEQFIGSSWLKLDDGAVVFFKKYGYPTGMLREASVEQEGWYRVRVTGYAYQSDRPVTFELGAVTFQQGAFEPVFGYFELPAGAPTTIETRAYIPRRYMLSVTPVGITDQDNELRRVGLSDYRGPGLAIQHVEVEGPLVDEFPSRGEQLLFAGLNRREVPPRNPQERERSWYKPRFEVAPADPARDVPAALMRIASAAFRRPATEEHVAPYAALYAQERAGGASVEAALRTAAAAIFCAPQFLYLQEPAGRLDDYALASRLSYFLIRTAPDAELLAAASSGRLTGDPTELRRQTDRLLAHPHHERFVADFTDAWLNLREIEFTNPDETLYPEFDRPLQHAMVAETRAFWSELISRNLPVVNVVKSDFAMLNERLAEHYGITGVQGPQIRRVPLPRESVRGGFLSQGAVLKVSANGTNTSPVVRGVWVLERILGETPPPPPPSVPAVEPDIRGATTLRELLDKHRSLDSCRACHQAIDPPGFALESFDPIGGWRERFRSVGEGDVVRLTVHGQKVRYRLGPPVDASGVLPGGRAFTGFTDFRDCLADDPHRLARALAKKLLTFGTGREIGFSDRPEIERLVQATAANGYGVRDIIHAVIGSEIFLTK